MSATELPQVQADYERLRRHGLSHDLALEAVAAGEPYRCWCGSERLCTNGAQSHVGCQFTREMWTYRGR